MISHLNQIFSRPLAAVLSIEFPWNRAQKKSDPNAESHRFATFAFLKQVGFSKKSETFRAGSDGYSGQSITCTRATDTGVSRYSTLDEKEHKSRQKMFALWVHGPLIFRSILETDSASVSSNHGGDPHKSLHRFVAAKISKTLKINVFMEIPFRKNMHNRETRDFVWIRKGSGNHLGKYFPLHKGG